MTTDDKEHKKAWMLDKIVTMIIAEPSKTKEPVYLGDIESVLQINNLKLRRYLKEESDTFRIDKESPTFGNRIEGQVILTDRGREKYNDDGPWFVKELEKRREMEKITAEADKIRQESYQARNKIAEEAERMEQEREAEFRDKQLI